MDVGTVRLACGQEVSRVGLGGHYRAMEEGEFECRFAEVDAYEEGHALLVRRAVEAGITYFDTTWRNEVEMLARALRSVVARDRVFVNGMVLGVFNGSKAQGVTPEDYFNRWLDDRLARMPGHRFDSVMVNAIEEGFDEQVCERLIALLEKRRAAGELRLIGFSSHNHTVARQVLDRFPQFELVMLPYNFHTRSRFEEAFAGYAGSTSFVAMKTLVWKDYGVPFCALNRLSRFSESMGFDPVPEIQSHAINFALTHPLVKVAVSSANTVDELDGLVRAGQMQEQDRREEALRSYEQAMLRDEGLYLFLGALEEDNLRMNYFGAAGLARLLKIPMPAIPLNEPDSAQRIKAFAATLKQAVA